MLREYIDTFKITKKASRKVKALKGMEFDQLEINAQVQKAWSNYKQVVGNELLNKMPIERLSDVEAGMPIQILQNYGLNSAGDCLHKS